MILEKGNMWDVFFHTDIFMITTNPIIKNDGSVVMGRGIAKQAKERYPDLPFDFGKRLLEEPPHDRSCVGYIGHYEETPIWYFMVKSNWMRPAELDIIRQSVFDMTHVYPTLLNKRIDLNFPGIGNGQLLRRDVLPLLEVLPDNVHVWEYE